MWNRIAASSVLMIGAVILFIIFTAALFIMEKRSENPSKRRRTQPRAKAITAKKPHSVVVCHQQDRVA